MSFEPRDGEEHEIKTQKSKRVIVETNKVGNN
jgi:hypothetical protein